MISYFQPRPVIIYINIRIDEYNTFIIIIIDCLWFESGVLNLNEQMIRNIYPIFHVIFLKILFDVHRMELLLIHFRNYIFVIFC